jgi:hypothetical protein
MGHAIVARLLLQPHVAAIAGADDDSGRRGRILVVVYRVSRRLWSRLVQSAPGGIFYALSS